MFILLIALLLLGSSILITLVFMPAAEGKFKAWQAQKEDTINRETIVGEGYHDKVTKQIFKLYFVLPPVFGILAYILTGHILFVIVGVLIGLFIPGILLKLREAQTRGKFNHQILDAIMILSSSLKGGLSLLQALEVLTEEMPEPMSRMIARVVKENKMGVSLEDSLRHLDTRMKMEELNLVVNSILVARETGGDLTKVFSRLSVTIRDNRKLKDSIRTLTLQGRLQGLIMSVLPFLFIWWVVTFNRHHFDIMLQSDIGRILLIAAAVLQIVGMFLIRKFSAIKI